MEEFYSRTGLLIGEAGIKRLRDARVAVFGIGGVGGYCVEALARCGIGSLVLVDSDTVAESNLNRQIIATRSTIGMDKVDAAAARIRDINPDCRVEIHRCFFLPETAGDFAFADYDYVVDAVDTVTAKLQIIASAREAEVPVISSMGAGNKLDPTGFMVADIEETEIDPLARVMRRELRKRGIRHVKVVYSKEKPVMGGSNSGAQIQEGSSRRSVPGSISFVPSVCGLILAGEVVRDLIT